MGKLAAVLTVTVLALVACGGDDDADVTDTTDVTETTEEDAEDTAPDETSVPDESDQDDGGDAAGTDSCSLLTPAQIGDVVGTAFDAGSDILGSCEYASTDGSTNVSVELIDSDRYEEREAGEGVDAVDGIGEAAFADTSTGFLYVNGGDAYFRVNVSGVPTDAMLAMNEDLARLILEEL